MKGQIKDENFQENSTFLMKEIYLFKGPFIQLSQQVIYIPSNQSQKFGRQHKILLSSEKRIRKKILKKN